MTGDIDIFSLNKLPISAQTLSPKTRGGNRQSTGLDSPKPIGTRKQNAIRYRHEGSLWKVG